MVIPTWCPCVPPTARGAGPGLLLDIFRDRSAGAILICFCCLAGTFPKAKHGPPMGSVLRICACSRSLPPCFLSCDCACCCHLLLLLLLCCWCRVFWRSNRESCCMLVMVCAFSFSLVEWVAVSCVYPNSNGLLAIWGAKAVACFRTLVLWPRSICVWVFCGTGWVCV